eukprot:10159282-Lingulodinium_polyedra.AAC.1
MPRPGPLEHMQAALLRPPLLDVRRTRLAKSRWRLVKDSQPPWPRLEVLEAASNLRQVLPDAFWGQGRLRHARPLRAASSSPVLVQLLVLVERAGELLAPLLLQGHIPEVVLGER